MVLSSTRFPLHRRNHLNMKENQYIFRDSGFPTLPTPLKPLQKTNGNHAFQWFWAPNASHFTEEIFKSVLKMYTFSMILGFPRFPIHRKMCWNFHMFNDSGLLTLPTHQKIIKNVWKCILSQWFWTSHASHCTEEITHGEPYISNNSAISTLPTPPKKSLKNIEICIVIWFWASTLTTPPQKS